MHRIGMADLAAIAERQTADGANLVEHEGGLLVPWPHTIVGLEEREDVCGSFIGPMEAVLALLGEPEGEEAQHGKLEVVNEAGRHESG